MKTHRFILRLDAKAEGVDLSAKDFATQLFVQKNGALLGVVTADVSAKFPHGVMFNAKTGSDMIMLLHAFLDREWTHNGHTDERFAFEILVIPQMSRRARESVKKTTEKILEELCVDNDCTKPGEHWHPFAVASILAEAEGEYTVTLRVRRP